MIFAIKEINNPNALINKPDKSRKFIFIKMIEK